MQLMKTIVLCVDFLVAIFSVIRNWGKQYLATSIHIHAPKSKVRDTFNSYIQLNTNTPMFNGVELNEDDILFFNDATNLARVHHLKNIKFPVIFSEVELGNQKDFCLNLTSYSDDQSTIVNQYDFLEKENFVQKLSVSFETRRVLRIIKTDCENKELRHEDGFSRSFSPHNSALCWSLLSSAFIFLGCCYTYNLFWAIVIMMVLCLYEFGHALALKLLGFRIKGTLFIPFISSFEDTDFKFRSSLNEAFALLLSPYICVLPTLFFLMLYLFTENITYGVFAAIVSLICLMQLMPIFPLDGFRLSKIIYNNLNNQDILALIYTTGMLSMIVAFINGYMVFSCFGLIVLGCLARELTYVNEGHSEIFSHDDINEGGKLSGSGKALILLCLLSVVVFYYSVLSYTLANYEISNFIGFQ